MPRACPVEIHLGCYERSSAKPGRCQACPVEIHESRYHQAQNEDPTLWASCEWRKRNVSSTLCLLTEVSLKPIETISGAASELKGQVSNWLKTQLGLTQPRNLLSHGYFACTVGKNTSAEVEQYLNTQAEHHGYSIRAIPPVYLESYEPDECNITPRHAKVISRFHIVLSTSGRKGIFGFEEAKRIASEWTRLQSEWRAAILKVSFVPDHVHLALRLHPSVSPSEIAVKLMNASRDLMGRELISAGLDRLWMQSAYIGSYGDLAGAQIRK